VELVKIVIAVVDVVEMVIVVIVVLVEAAAAAAAAVAAVAVVGVVVAAAIILRTCLHMSSHKRILNYEEPDFQHSFKRSLQQHTINNTLSTIIINLYCTN
jgi:hypothetical protein